jgi:hypothetical protein
MERGRVNTCFVSSRAKGKWRWVFLKKKEKRKIRFVLLKYFWNVVFKVDFKSNYCNKSNSLPSEYIFFRFVWN